MLDENLSVWPGPHTYIEHWRTELGTASVSSVTACSRVCVSFPTSTANHAVDRQSYGPNFAPCDGKICQDSDCRKKSCKSRVSLPTGSKTGENKPGPAVVLTQKCRFWHELMVDCQFWWMWKTILTLPTKTDNFYVAWGRCWYFFRPKKFANKHTFSRPRGHDEKHSSELVFIRTKLNHRRGKVCPCFHLPEAKIRGQIVDWHTKHNGEQPT